jgi:FKBP-type peptidyl-prolyl cis-trans isomerase FkpA
MNEGMMKRTRWGLDQWYVAAAFTAAIIVGGCAHPASTSETSTSAAPATAGQSPPSDVARTTFDPSLGIHLDSMTARPSGLYVQDLVTGTGGIVALGRSVVVHYTGWLPNGKQFETGEVTVTLGSNKTIRGWEEGLLGMRVGGKRRLIVPPHLAYGSRAAGEIPANAILVFEVQAMSVF